MRLFKILEHERNKKNIHKIDEYKFYIENRSLLNRNSVFLKYYNVEDAYDVICANLVIQSIINKDKLDQIIEEEYISSSERRIENIKQEINERIIDLPFV